MFAVFCLFITLQLPTSSQAASVHIRPYSNRGTNLGRTTSTGGSSMSFEVHQLPDPITADSHLQGDATGNLSRNDLVAASASATQQLSKKLLQKLQLLSTRERRSVSSDGLESVSRGCRAMNVTLDAAILGSVDGFHVISPQQITFAQCTNQCNMMDLTGGLSPYHDFIRLEAMLSPERVQRLECMVSGEELVDFQIASESGISVITMPVPAACACQ